jgi:hypothetical protein
MTPPDHTLALLCRRDAYADAERASRWPLRIAKARMAWLASLSDDEHDALQHADALRREYAGQIRAECATRPTTTEA